MTSPAPLSTCHPLALWLYGGAAVDKGLSFLDYNARRSRCIVKGKLRVPIYTHTHTHSPDYDTTLDRSDGGHESTLDTVSPIYTIEGHAPSQRHVDDALRMEVSLGVSERGCNVIRTRAISDTRCSVKFACARARTDGAKRS